MIAFKTRGQPQIFESQMTWRANSCGRKVYGPFLAQLQQFREGFRWNIARIDPKDEQIVANSAGGDQILLGVKTLRVIDVRIDG